MQSAVTAGVTSDRFWKLTPAEITLEIDAWRQNQLWENYKIGLLCCVIAEPHRNEKLKPKPFQPSDFLQIGDELKEIVKPKKQTWQEQLDIIKRLNTALGGGSILVEEVK